LAINSVFYVIIQNNCLNVEFREKSIRIKKLSKSNLLNLIAIFFMIKIIFLALEAFIYYYTNLNGGGVKVCTHCVTQKAEKKYLKHFFPSITCAYPVITENTIIWAIFCLLHSKWSFIWLMTTSGNDDTGLWSLSQKLLDIALWNHYTMIFFIISL